MIYFVGLLEDHEILFSSGFVLSKWSQKYPQIDDGYSRLKFSKAKYYCFLSC